MNKLQKLSVAQIRSNLETMDKLLIKLSVKAQVEKNNLDAEKDVYPIMDMVRTTIDWTDAIIGDKT